MFSGTNQAIYFDETEDDNSDIQETETYTLDLTSGNTVVSAEDFTALLEENKTKDVVIQSNNGVTFTFAKGAMQEVEGKDSYDFSTTLNTTYTEDLPYYVTQNNFVSLIDYNYSGKLPAEATIRFCVGTQFAGKTLYYYLLNEDKTFAEVQTVTVDAQGYITVKQDHCSRYVVSSEKPELQNDGNVDDTTTPSTDNTTAPSADNTTTPNTDSVTSPKTGDNGFVIPSILACAGMLGFVAVTRKRSRA